MFRSNGSTLVICTEGNAGFYEIGIMVTPMDLGYSVLGWNHPGFGCSTVRTLFYCIVTFSSNFLNVLSSKGTPKRIPCFIRFWSSNEKFSVLQF